MNVSPKAQALCELLESIDLESAPETRMIIFVETKGQLAGWRPLQEYLSGKGLRAWNPTALRDKPRIQLMEWLGALNKRPILLCSVPGM